MGPIAMSYVQNKGWVLEELGPKHWKRLARQNKQTSPTKESGPSSKLFFNLCSIVEPNECVRVELLGIGVVSGNLITHHGGGETKNHTLVFLAETKAQTSRMKGL